MAKQKHEAAYFCHGMPGSAHDARLLQGVDEQVQLIASNMLTDRSGDFMSDVLRDFDVETKAFSDGKINVVGFSMGAMVAIKIAAARPNRVGKLTLISPAAPLSLGDFLPQMAGQSVFKLAMNSPRALKVLTFAQGLASAMAPRILTKQLFAKCGETEKDLLKNPTFFDVLGQGFSNSYRLHPDAYMGVIRTYVSDWSEDLRSVTCPVELWHGVQDTWSPIAMSHGLCDHITSPCELHSIHDTEHYSTLAKVTLKSLTKASNG